MSIRSLFLQIMVAVPMLLLGACAEETKLLDVYLYKVSQPKNYFKSTETMTVEVYYEPTAEPYINDEDGKPLWDILHENMTDIFAERSEPPSIDVPKSLAEMYTPLPEQNRNEWTAQAIYNLHLSYRDKNPSSSNARFYIYFLRGYLSNDGQIRENVIGASLSKTPIIAIFKDVVETSGNVGGPLSNSEEISKYVEQITLVHEMGHAFGFVNSGVPMTEPHQDEEHGAHTTEEDCVMYWANEGASSVFDFVTMYESSGSAVMWGENVKADANAYSQ